ncbi:TIR domain-containing protein [Heyndrickxia sporothermodurans]|uniref:TIR domain-containing protein n=1 Tax=Bacillaceae TaxID=186817 RepID=UPI001BA37CBA|nr:MULTISPECIES: TIR domain-containing protein [Bacillaceae]MED3653983.1 TIR domain-containing protein [Heyndrickxia sporothermodurans]UHA60911.1 TIR domain-containing protein [Metabacillus litoralis]WNS75665.1 TIR domain-containing protein [Bacillus sp. DTU_2020_1000418_1_SI_GHA_SEK_038]
MARKTFFSFHFERDSWRAGQVRNSGQFKGDKAGFIDKADWEEVKRKGDQAIKNWIDKQLEGTSTTVVLIGSETSERKYVGYEIEQSAKRGNGLLGVYIHRVKDANGSTDTKGKNPFDNWYYERDGKKVYFSEIYPTYDWVSDNGRDNLGKWIEAAAKKAGK